MDLYFGRVTKYLGNLSPEKKIELFRLILRPDFQEAVETIRNKWGIDLSQATDSVNGEKEYLRYSENNDLFKEARVLAKKFNASKRWAELLLDYIIYDNFIPSYDPDGLALEIDRGKNWEDAPDYYLALTPETTIEDIKKVWPEIKSQLEKEQSRSRRKPWKTFWRDYNIYQLASEGKDILEIRREIKKEFGDDLDVGNIKKIESSFRRRLSIPKKSKLKTRRKSYR